VGNQGAEVRLIAGEEDAVCAPQLTEPTRCDRPGYELDPTILADADHFAPIFRSEVVGGLVAIEDDRAGEQTVELILDAIEAAQTGVGQ
jgi:hypothetical protein